MKLKLQARNTETIRTTLSLVSLLRKFVVLRFTPEKLIVILVHPTAMVPEPQAWCKLNVKSVFDSIEIQSLHENVILLEVNIDLYKPSEITIKQAATFLIFDYKRRTQMVKKGVLVPAEEMHHWHFSTRTLLLECAR